MSVDTQSPRTYVDIISPPSPVPLTGPWLMKRGSLLPAYRGTLRRADKSPVDLNDPQIDHIDFVMRQRRTLTPLVEAEVMILQQGDADTGTDVGVCEYDWQPGDTDISGDYYGEFALYDANGNVLARIPNDSYQEIRILGNLSMTSVSLDPSVVQVSVLPEKISLTAFQGDDFTFQISVTSDGQPTDLTGATATANIYAHSLEEQPIAAFDPLVDPAGMVYLTLPAGVSATLPKSTVWDCEMQRPGDTKTLAYGWLHLISDVAP